MIKFFLRRRWCLALFFLVLLCFFFQAFGWGCCWVAFSSLLLGGVVLSLLLLVLPVCCVSLGEVGSSLFRNESSGLFGVVLFSSFFPSWWCCFGGVSFRCCFVSWAVLFSSLLCVLSPHPSLGWCCLPPPPRGGAAAARLQFDMADYETMQPDVTNSK